MQRAIHRLQSLRADQSGVAIIEFAVSLPFLVGVTLYGAELANLAYAHQKVGDIATLTADSISRFENGINETQVTDVMRGMKILGEGLTFGQNGRIIVSSVKPVTNVSGTVTNQNIRWQRCSGALRQNSSYGQQGLNLGVGGIGPNTRKIAASADSELIFVEVRYRYQPLISNALFGEKTVSAIAGMSVRQRLADQNNLAAGTASTCDQYSA